MNSENVEDVGFLFKSVSVKWKWEKIVYEKKAETTSFGRHERSKEEEARIRMRWIRA